MHHISQAVYISGTTYCHDGQRYAQIVLFKSQKEYSVNISSRTSNMEQANPLGRPEQMSRCTMGVSVRQA